MAEDDENTEIWSDGTPGVPVAPPAAAPQPALPPPTASRLGPPIWLIAGGAVVVLLIVGAAIWRFMPAPNAAHVAVADSSTPIAPDQETDPLWKKCESTDPDTKIAGCAAIIAANTETPQNLATAHINRGFAYRGKNQDNLALPDFNEAIRLDPNNAAGYEGRGNVDIDTGNFDQASADFGTEIRLVPDASGGYKGRADVDAHKSDWPAALADNNKALQLEPTYEEALEGRGGVYLVMQQWDLAIADFTVALKTAPNSEPANAGLGAALGHKGQYAQAIPYLNQALALNGKDALAAGAFYNRAVAKLFTGDLQGAVADENSAKQLNPNVPDLPVAPSG
jgi:tetratricopeptide (TPR) repeat protein